LAASFVWRSEQRALRYSDAAHELQDGYKMEWALGIQPKMAGHELSKIFLVPFNWWLIEHDKLRCQNTICGREIDLSGENWLAFRKGLNEVLASVQQLYESLPTRSRLRLCRAGSRAGR
jgi:hypothetical protein